MDGIAERQREWPLSCVDVEMRIYMIRGAKRDYEYLEYPQTGCAIVGAWEDIVNQWIRITWRRAALDGIMPRALCPPPPRRKSKHQTFSPSGLAEL